MNNSTVVNDTLQEFNNGTDSSGGAGFASNGLTTGIVVNTFLIVLIVGGNFLVVAAYAKNRRLRTGTYALMVSLALSDLLVGGVALPIRISGSVKNWQVSVIFNFVFTAFDIFSAVASNLHLMALSFERFVAVSRPFYHQTLTVRPYAFASMMSWILAVVAASLHPQYYFQNGDDIAFEAYTVTLFSLCFLGPLTVISIVNIRIFRIARVLIQRAPLQDGNDMGQRLRKERKTALTLLFMTGFFFIAWFPFFVMNMLFLYCIECLPSSLNAQLVMVDIIKCLHYSNSAINPVIYAFRDIEMRRTFARLLGPFGRLCRVNQVEPEFSNTQVVIDLQTRK